MNLTSPVSVAIESVEMVNNSCGVKGEFHQNHGGMILQFPKVNNSCGVKGEFHTIHQAKTTPVE